MKIEKEIDIKFRRKNMRIRFTIRFNIGDVCMLIAILFRIVLCIKDGYISTYNAFWLIALICFEIFCFVEKNR